MTGTFIQSMAVKDILTGVLLCLLIIAIMYIIPMIGIFAWMFLPLPVLFYRLKTGRNSGGIIMAISLAILMIVTRNIAFNTLYFGSLLITGFFLGEFIEKHLSVEKIMLYTCFCVLGAFMAALLVYALTQSLSLDVLISNYASRYHALSSELFKESAQLYPEMNVDRQMLEKASSLFVLAFPGIFINSYLTMAWLNILLIKKLLFKKGIIVKSIENLNQWKAPEHLVFGVIVLCGLIFLSVDVLKLLSVNCLIVLLFVYFFQGIAVVSFYFQKKSAPLAFRFFFYILIAVQPFFLLLVIGFGLFDTWINFRKLDTARS